MAATVHGRRTVTPLYSSAGNGAPMDWVSLPIAKQIISSKRVRSKSIAMVGGDGEQLRNRSKSSPCAKGSRSVIPSAQAT